MNKYLLMSNICFVIALIMLGWIGSVYYNPNIIKEEVIINKCLTQAKISGLWLPDLNELKNYNGKWICVNIDETKDLNELNRICNHEIGHEIFARECESNITKCMEISE